MSRFSRIVVKGFRRLCDTSLELPPLSVMIGANGVGKTSFLDVFDFLAASSQSGLRNKINDFGGVQDLVTYDKAQRLEFDLSMEVEKDAPLDYRLVIAPAGVAYTIEEETLTQQRSPQPPPFRHIESHGADIKYFEVGERQFMRPSWEHSPFETSLSQVPRMFREPEEFRSKLASSTFYHVLDVAPRAPVRLPQPLHPAELPGKNGEDLVSCLFYLRETQRDRFEIIEDTLQAAMSGFERLDFPPVAAGTLAMTWKDRNFRKPLFMHQLSEGTLRFLWLTTLLHSPGLTAVTLLDEPEVSLHPELLSILADVMREASRRSQLIVATHSDRLVRFLQPQEIVVMDLEDDGTARMTRGDELGLDEWLREFTLDQVWQMGRMGGRA